MSRRSRQARWDASADDGEPDAPAVGSLTVAFVSGVTLSKWTRTWAERRPDVAITVIEVSEREQVAALHDGRADLSFARLPVDRTGLHVIPLYREVAVVLAAKDSAIAAFDTVTLADLAGETRLNDVGDVDLIAAGGGVAVVPHSIARLHSRKDLVARTVTDAPETEVAVAWRADIDSPAIVSVIDEFIGVVRGRTARSSRSGQVGGSTPRARGRKR